jgi:hypothetical protein
VSGLIDWLADLRATAGTGALPALPTGGAAPAWVRQFVLDLAAPAEDPNAGLQVALLPGVSPPVALV